ncbi:HNH endonuclease [Planococcus shenhongbingii]|uniref:HNH endonuclease n=1 Tax=Planococcus shenhongbingii TaxID=3058398 RepID=A0ABT8NGH9_9BACL|nr:HNH endonuclease [Planococcus sp. N017]MDN7246993.1 HNH endonuclease [Planococcus sp. N017]
MNCFIVMQGETYQEEKKMGLLWTPQRDKSGMVPHSYKRMRDIKKGDRIFHYVKGYIVALSVAKENCRLGNKPIAVNMANGKEEKGYYVSVEYHELEQPLSIHEHFDELASLLPVKYAAFQEDGSGNPGYLYPCNEELAIKMLEGISMLNVYVPEEEQLELAIEVIRTTEHNPLVPLIAETILEAKTKMQRGEQQFRKRLTPLWNKLCPLCGMDLEPVLKASYAKPWKDSSDPERLDPYNGVLLCSNHDSMYSYGLITINANGKLQISATIPEEKYSDYGLSARLRIPVYPENSGYFKWHKKNIFIDKRSRIATLHEEKPVMEEINSEQEAAKKN